MQPVHCRVQWEIIQSNPSLTWQYHNGLWNRLVLKSIQETLQQHSTCWHVVLVVSCCAHDIYSSWHSFIKSAISFTVLRIRCVCHCAASVRNCEIYLACLSAPVHFKGDKRKRDEMKWKENTKPTAHKINNEKSTNKTGGPPSALPWSRIYKIQGTNNPKKNNYKKKSRITKEWIANEKLKEKHNRNWVFYHDKQITVRFLVSTNFIFGWLVGRSMDGSVYISWQNIPFWECLENSVK